MARGGRRPGAGRKKGAATRMNEEARRKAAEGGEMPQDYMLRIMRDETTNEKRRDAMAIAAAPYCHAKLAAVEHTGKDGGPIEVAAIERRIVRANAGN